MSKANLKISHLRRVDSEIMGDYPIFQAAMGIFWSALLTKQAFGEHDGMLRAVTQGQTSFSTRSPDN
jgi:hypothetical protein